MVSDAGSPPGEETTPDTAGGEIDEPVPTPRSVDVEAVAPSRSRRSARRGSVVVGIAIVAVAAVAAFGWSRGRLAPPASITEELEARARSAIGEEDAPAVTRLDVPASSTPDRPEWPETAETPIDESAPTRGAGADTGREAMPPELATLLGARPVLVSFAEPLVVITEDGRRHEVGDAIGEDISLVAIERTTLVFDRAGDRLEMPLPARLTRDGAKIE